MKYLVICADGTRRPSEKWAEIYTPTNLDKFIGRREPTLPVVDTKRIMRERPYQMNGDRS